MSIGSPPHKVLPAGTPSQMEPTLQGISSTASHLAWRCSQERKRVLHVLLPRWMGASGERSGLLFLLNLADNRSDFILLS